MPVDYDTPDSQFSERIEKEILRLEANDKVARRQSYVVIPHANLWRKIGHRTFYRLFGLHYFDRESDPETCGIQKAVNAARSRVFVKDSTYPIGTMASVAKNNFGMEGETREGTIIQAKTGLVGGFVLNMNSTSAITRTGFELSHITLDANLISGGTFGTLDLIGAPGNTTAANTFPIKYATIFDCAFINGKTGNNNLVQLYPQNSTIIGCRFAVAGSSLLFLVPASNLTVANCMFENWAGGAGLTLGTGSTPNTYPADVVVTNCNFDNTAQTGIALGIEASSVNDITVDNCTFLNMLTGAQFDVISGSNGGRNNLVRGCTFKVSAAGTAIAMNINGQITLPKGYAIIGNVVNGGGLAMTLGGIRGLTITGNSCVGQAGLSTRGTVVSGIYVSTNGASGAVLATSAVVISDNTIVDGATGNAILLDTLAASSTYNIDDLTIQNNDLRGNASPFLIVGIGSVTNYVLRNNPGYNAQAISTITAGASPWTYTNNDGYDEILVLTTVGGISALTYRGTAGYPITANAFPFWLQPGQTIVVTWATTAPVFTKYPQ